MNVCLRSASCVLFSKANNLRHMSNQVSAIYKMQAPYTTSSGSSDEQIHILGVGNIGTLFTVALSQPPKPRPLTIHLHRPDLLPILKSANSTLTLLTPTGPLIASNLSVSSPSSTNPIKNIVVTTKAPHITSALSALSHRLGPSSILLFTQNGLGIIEDVTSKVFPDPAKRPQYLACITTHGVYTVAPFKVEHAGPGTLYIGPVGTNIPTPQSKYLIEAITFNPILNATAVDAQSLYILQLQKLSINALINPLTVIFHCQNGVLAHTSNPHYGLIRRLQAAMIAEISGVLLNLKEIKEAAGKVKGMFSTERMRKTVDDVTWVNRKNRSSMLQDVEKGKETEIRWINGWIVDRGKEMGLECKVNARVVELVGSGFPREHEDLEAVFKGYF